jgi:hypothetical protein
MHELKEQERRLLQIRDSLTQSEGRISAELRGVQLGLERVDVDLREVRLQLAERGEAATTSVSAPPRAVVVPDGGSLVREAEHV